MKIANFFTAARIILMAPLLFFILKSDDWSALVFFLLAGLSDIIDGYLARKSGLSSQFGAFFDLFADRFLTLIVGIGLIARFPNDLLIMSCAIILIARNELVAGLNEALPGKLEIKVSMLEKIKIALNFLGFGILISPLGGGVLGILAFDWGKIFLASSAILTISTMVDYSGRASKYFRQKS